MSEVFIEVMNHRILGIRTRYPNGVPSSHPAYQSKMDRDNDNYACER